MESPQSNINTALPSNVLHAVFAHLEPRSLVAARCTCRLWRALDTDAASNKAWQAWYLSRWSPLGLPPRYEPGELPGASPASAPDWSGEYGRKMQRLRAWGGKCEADSLYGHNSGVRAVRLLPSQRMVFTGSKDRTVRAWDLDLGLPLSTSSLHGGIVRCLASDEDLLVSGGSDTVLRTWRAAAPGMRPSFDVSTPPQLLRAHTGPVSCLSLSARHVFSGSWDGSVRLWDRASLAPVAALGCGDWVTALAARGCRLHVLAGRSVVTADVETGAALASLAAPPDAPKWCAMEATYDGNYLFLGSDAGVLSAHDLRAPMTIRSDEGGGSVSGLPLARWRSGVSALSLEHPWLAAGTRDGGVALLDVEAALRGGGAGSVRTAKPAGHAGAPRSVLGGERVTRRLYAGAAVHSVDVADAHCAAGTESDVVRTWRFSAVSSRGGHCRRQAAMRAARAAAQEAGEHCQQLACQA